MEPRVPSSISKVRRCVGPSGGLVAVSIGAAELLFSSSAIAQPSGMCDTCSGMMGGAMGPMMWVGMIVVWLIGIAAFAALVALTVYLIRRSRL
jgi:hypothetical protein